AGGGSICWFDGHRLRVGPESAGAHPGPACYGAGGPLTMTDVNLLLGRLNPLQFEIPINKAPAETVLEQLIENLSEQTGERLQIESALNGFLDIANECMADAIRSVSIRKGYDPTDYALLAFGGAGGQHACAIAELLDIQTVVIPPDASLLSALGIGHASIERFASKQILQPLENIIDDLDNLLAHLVEQAINEVAKEGIATNQIVVRRKIIHLRFSGQESSLGIDFDESQKIKEGFIEKYRIIYGYVPNERQVEVESIRVIASELKPARAQRQSKNKLFNARIKQKRQAYFQQEWHEVPVFQRQELSPGARFYGPALFFEKHSAVVIYPGWHARLDEIGSVVLENRLHSK
ncbi:MAG: hydantoinase/oxoprolinase family protein, partial [bacterium]